ncbi:hypothetical protein H0H92_010517 [Tricholoma furcatifolium]|nr:hypothetical protein H0H92_010517 [Tricholoma furcatifolium]
MLSVWKRSWKEKTAPVDAEQDMLDGPGGSSSSLDSTVAAHPSDAALAEPSLPKRRLSYTASNESPRKRVRFDVSSPAIEQEDLSKQVQKEDRFLITHRENELSDERCPAALVFYEPAKPGVTSTLTKELEKLNWSKSTFVQTYLDDSRATLDEVGCCASDLLWRRTFKENDAKRDHGNETDGSFWESIQQCIKNWTFSLPNLDITSSQFNVTHKFLVLVKTLESCASYGDAFRGVVLVKRRAVAFAIAELLRLLDGILVFRPISVDWNDISSAQKQTNHVHPRSFNTECSNFDEDIGQTAQARVIHMVQKKGSHQSSERLFHRVRTTCTIKCQDDIPSSTFIQDPTTCSRLYLTDSVDAINRFASTGNGLEVPQVLFDFREKHVSPSERHFDCIVTIPGVLRVIGPPGTSELNAKSAACFKLCQYLSLLGLLDCRFFPQMLSANTSVDEEVHHNSSNHKALGSRRYLRKEPNFWVNAKDTTNILLYPIVISSASPDGQAYAPLALLSRQPLPHLENIEVFHARVPAIVSFRRCVPLDLQETRLHELCRYTTRLCRTLYNKPLECSRDDLVCFFAPLTPDWTSIDRSVSSSPFDLPSVANYIHWDLVQLAGDRYNTPIKMTTLQELEIDMHDSVILDRSAEFTRKYFVVGVRLDMSPLSKPSENSREAAFSSILEFTKSRMKTFEELKDVNQPLIEVATVPPVFNQLCPISQQPPITPSHAKLKELNGNLFKHRISEPLLHMSLCTPSSGARHDYERLEVLGFEGDAFLKCLSSMYLYVTFPANKEGQLHEARQNLISNRSLYEHACQAGIPNYILSKLFSTRLWTPPFCLPLSANLNRLDPQDEAETEQSLTVSVQDPSQSTHDGKAKKRKKRRKKQTSDDQRLQRLGDKVVADVAEAILGAGYLTGGEETALQVAKAIGIPFSGIESWTDFAKKCTAASSESSLKRAPLEAVESIIGYKIKNSPLLAMALLSGDWSSWAMHCLTSVCCPVSVPHIILKTKAVVVRDLYELEQQLQPGELTLLKAAMVSNSALAALCVCSGLHEHFVHNSQPLQSSIYDYVLKLKASQAKAYRDAEVEGRLPGQFWEEINAPKVGETCLSDVVEATMAAIYVGDKFSLEGVQIVFETWFRPFYEKHISLETLSHHPTKRLFELIQKHGCRRFTIENDAGDKKETVKAEGKRAI